MKPSDADLIAAVRDGDPDGAASRDLFERHWHAVVGAARRYGDPVTADDIAQEAMVRVFDEITRGRGPTPAFGPYVIASVRDVAVSWAGEAQAVSLVDIGTLAVLIDGRRRVDPVQTVEDRELLVRAFSSLSSRHRQVLWHTIVEGRTPAELAPLYGLSANGVAAIAARARRRLRRVWLQTASA